MFRRWIASDASQQLSTCRFCNCAVGRDGVIRRNGRVRLVRSRGVLVHFLLLYFTLQTQTAVYSNASLMMGVFLDCCLAIGILISPLILG